MTTKPISGYRLKDARDAEIASDYLAGLTLEKACAKHGVTAKVGVRVLRNMGIPARKGRPGKRLKDKQCIECGRVFSPNRSIHVVCGHKCALSRARKAGTRRTHGGSRTREYKIWTLIKHRVNNEWAANYHRYGGRGITICPEWNDSFEAFIRDMGPRPSPRHSVERVDNNKGYEKSNCVWATRVQQARNTRKNRCVEYDGRSVSIAELSELSGINYARLYNRLVLHKWSVEMALEK